MLYIFSTKNSEVLRRLSSLSWNVGVSFNTYGDDYNIRFKDDDYVMLRWDSIDTDKNWFKEVRDIAKLADNAGTKVFDFEYWRQLPRMRDKYVQSIEYKTKSVPHVPSFLLSEFKCEIEYPVLIKKRLGGMGVGTLIVENDMEMSAAKSRLNVSEYIVQPYKKVVKDFRIVIFGGSIYGVVVRNVVEHDDKSIGVRVNRQVELSNAEMEVVDKYMGEFKPEFVGLDVLVDESGYIWVTECNYSPLYSGFERVSGRDVIADMKDVLEGIVL